VGCVLFVPIDGKIALTLILKKCPYTVKMLTGFVLSVQISVRKLRMSKCKHGFSFCSECGNESDRNNFSNTEIVTDDIEKFNSFCADKLGYRPSYRNRTQLWLDDGKEIIKSNFNPYENHAELIKVIKYMMETKDNVR
jgi:hypothetical protein